MRSSTSSSEMTSAVAQAQPARIARGGGFPWALVMAVTILAALEVLVRRMDPAVVIAYERGTESHYAVRDYIDLVGPADVCFVGSSRTMMDVVSPEVQYLCEKALGRAIKVANYACAGANVRESCAAIDRMSNASQRPKVILFGVSPDELRGLGLYSQNVAVYWHLGDWAAAWSKSGRQVLPYLPIVTRNEIAERYRTFRYRHSPFTLWRELSSDGVSLREMRGEMSMEHILMAEYSLKNHPVSAEVVRQNIQKIILVNGQYPQSDESIALLAGTNQRCLEKGVRLVLFETPNSDLVTAQMPEQANDMYGRAIGRLVDDQKMSYVSLKQLGVALSDAEFFDPVHLNREGAERFSRALADRAVVPALMSPAAR